MKNIIGSKALFTSNPREDKYKREWMMIQPKDGEPKSKTVNSKLWHQCLIDYNNGKGKRRRYK